jgi:hypothetical protein
MPQRKKLHLGDSDFKSVIENDYYYIDKSLFIQDILESEKAVMLLPRPRRFGKTLNLSMLKYFFDIREPQNKDLFTGLNIWQAEDEIKEKQGSYPVIYLTFKDTKKESWPNTLKHIKIEISKLYKQHRYLLKDDTLYADEKYKFENIIKEKADDVDYEVSIQDLSEFLYRYFKQKVIILIDEYDAPIQAGYNKFYREVIDFMRSLMSGAYKDNTYLYKGAITGILRVSKESIFSGLNNLSVYSILQTRFSDKFGFTQDEVQQIVKDFQIEADYEKIKEWYNGYQIGKTSNIYNPWAVLNYAAEHEEGFKTYWINTSSDELIKEQLLQKDAREIREEFLKLINNESINKNIEENFVFPELKRRKDLIWTLLTYSGYLTITKKVSRREYELCIPNYEIKTIFQDTILEWLESDMNIRLTTLQETTNHLVNNQIDEFEQGFKQIIGDTFSYYDATENHEYVYHSYMLGLLAIIGDDYIIRSNRESGEGRYDIVLLPRDKQNNGVVIEIKQISKQENNEPDDKFRERINMSIEKAAEQIDRHKYYKELLDYGLRTEQIIKAPVVFAGKEPYCTIM